MSNDFLFELGTEELPSASVKPLAEALAEHLSQSFHDAGLAFGTVRPFATPRRLAVLIRDVDTLQPSQKISRRGPALAAGMTAEGEPTRALMGFARSCAVSVDELIKFETDKGVWWGYESIQEGMPTKDLLPAMVNEALAKLPLKKPMRWGSGEAEFARPVHWAVLLFGQEVVETDVFGVTTGQLTFGHRFHHPQAIKLENPLDYEAMLHEAFVIADFNLRFNTIKTQIEQLAAENDLIAVMPDELLNEVTSIVECPNALLAGFAPEFLDVPAEALIEAMQVHQKCFALKDQYDSLQPYFITVANILSHQPEQVVAGNEKVMRARLSDAAFFFHQDKKQPLASHYEQTAQVVFEAKLGTLQEKSNRVAVLLEALSQPLQLDVQEALRAAYLSKCDLMTGMVGEFPELQGTMGFYYASHDGESKPVALALQEQYLPRFAKDKLPQSDLGRALSLADRMDTLVGIFAIGKKPTGVKDPFKLRRHALAVVRLLVSIPTKLQVSTLINQSLQTYQGKFNGIEDAIADLKSFILDRMQSFYQAQGVGLDVIYAVKAREDDWLFDVEKRIKALQSFILLPEAASLSQACKRVNNILNHATFSKDNKAVRDDLLKEPAEKALFVKMQDISATIRPLYSKGDYVAILSAMATLKMPVDAFFNEVMVMVDDLSLKENRLSLLVALQDLLQGVADISKLTSIHHG